MLKGFRKFLLYDLKLTRLKSFLYEFVEEDNLSFEFICIKQLRQRENREKLIEEIMETQDLINFHRGNIAIAYNDAKILADGAVEGGLLDEFYKPTQQTNDYPCG